MAHERGALGILLPSSGFTNMDDILNYLSLYYSDTTSTLKQRQFPIIVIYLYRVIDVPRTYKITEELTKQIFEKMKTTKESGAYRRLQAVGLRGKGRKNAEVAEATGFNSDYITVLVRKCVTEGLESLVSDNRKGSNNYNLNHEQEVEFLKPFLEKAAKGKIVNIGEIAKAYDKLTGIEHSSNSTVYKLLHRHDWRMVMPRGQHPNKASDEDIEASKKLT